MQIFLVRRFTDFGFLRSPRPQFFWRVLLASLLAASWVTSSAYAQTPAESPRSNRFGENPGAGEERPIAGGFTTGGFTTKGGTESGIAAPQQPDSLRGVRNATFAQNPATQNTIGQNPTGQNSGVGALYSASAFQGSAAAQPQQPQTPGLTSIQQQPSGGQATSPLVAQTNPDPWSLEAIQTKIDQAQASTELDPKIRDPLLDLYRQLQTELRSKSEAERLQKEWGAMAEQAPLATVEEKRKLEQAQLMASNRGSEFLPSVDRMADLVDLERRLQELQSELQAASDARTKADETINQRDKRRKDFPTALSTARERLAVIDRELATPPTDSIHPLLREAASVLLRTQRESLAEQIESIEQEQRAYEAEAELLPVRRDLAKLREGELEAQVRSLSEIVTERRKLGIELQLAQARFLKSQAPPELVPLADRILKRADDWLKLTFRRSEVQAELAATKTMWDQWSERFSRMESRIKPKPGQDVGGFNSWVGLMLRRQRDELPDPSRLRSQLRRHQTQMQDADSLVFELEDRRSQLLLAERDSSQLYGDIVEMEGLVPQNLIDQTLVLLAKEKEIIAGMRVEADASFNDLLQLADTKERLIDLTEKYREFIDQHVLWIRSSDQLKRADTYVAWEAFQDLVQLKNWQSVAGFIWRDLRNQPWMYLGLGLAMVLLISNQSMMRKRMVAISELVAKKGNVSFVPTMQAALITILAALPMPMLLAFLGIRMSAALDDEAFVRALGAGLLTAARFFASLELLRQVCRPSGLAIAHLLWPKAIADLLRTNLRWLLDLGIPIVTLVALFDAQSNTRSEESLGRITFIILMGLLCVFLVRVFRPRHGVLSHYLQQHSGGWLDRLRWVWYPLMAAGPIVLAGLSFTGFHYTAQRLAVHLHTTLWTLVGLVVLHNMMTRWLLLSRRKLMIAQAKQRLEDAAKKDPQTLAASIPEDSNVDLVAINAQTIRLVTSVLVMCGIIGVAFVWSGVLPAISILESVTLWTVEGATPNDRVAITLANIVLAVPIVVLMIVASRNFPGLLEIALLQHLPLDKAVRYAITSISSYTIVILGLILACSSIGLQWSSIQWLVAALGVGLGFGLQEIFANFVSGLIVLFEQPIRVGDVITIGDTTGVVSKIRMRSTTITNWDRQELIVPNKDLITGRLLNWTLSDNTNRIVVDIGIAYGSNAELACSLLTQICQRHPNVLRDPEPTVTLEGFADSSLSLRIRAFLSNIDNRLPTIHQLHMDINRAFLANGIEIAFPQRDLHIRSIPKELSQWFRKSEPRSVNEEQELPPPKTGSHILRKDVQA